MAKKAEKKVVKPKKEKAPKKDEALGAIPGSEEVKADAEVSKDQNSIEPTGKFEVVEVASGKFRMFNEKGQAVSPVVLKDDQTENGRPALAKLIRDSRRCNALRRKNEIATPKGHAIPQ